MKISEMIKVLQAYKEGKKIQAFVSRRWVDSPTNPAFVSRRWVDTPNPAFDFKTNKYRVNPEPRVFWLMLNEDGCVISAKTEMPTGIIANLKLIKVVEELP